MRIVLKISSPSLKREREKERKTILLQDVKIAFMRMSFSSAEPESEISSRIKLLLLAELILLLFSLKSS